MTLSGTVGSAALRGTAMRKRAEKRRRVLMGDSRLGCCASYTRCLAHGELLRQKSLHLVPLVHDFSEIDDAAILIPVGQSNIDARRFHCRIEWNLSAFGFG